MLRSVPRALLPRRGLCAPTHAAAAPEHALQPEESLEALGRALFSGPAPARLTFLVGGPGSGKGTLSEMAVSRMAYTHVSVGELLRREAASGSVLGMQVAPELQAGGIVTSAVAIRLLLEHIASGMAKGEGKEGWLVDGFPRKLKNALVWEDLRFDVARVVALEVEEGVLAMRLHGRGRADDLPGVIRNRIERHREEWPKMREFYERRGLLTVLDASGSPEEVWQRFVDARKEWS